jgi:PIN domain nuclease of toxin-antitoxin system
MILLDTHILIWLASDRSRLSESAKTCLEENAGSLAVSVVSTWEIAILVKKKRLELPLPAAEFLDRALTHYRILEIPLEREAILEAVGLPEIHQDPFDRILCAESRLRKAPVVTKDQVIPRYPGVEIRW